MSHKDTVSEKLFKITPYSKEDISKLYECIDSIGWPTDSYFIAGQLNVVTLLHYSVDGYISLLYEAVNGR